MLSRRITPQLVKHPANGSTVALRPFIIIAKTKSILMFGHKEVSFILQCWSYLLEFVCGKNGKHEFIGT